jgi:PAS domain-containing protein
MGICKDEVLQPEITELRRNAEILLKAKSPDAYLFRKGEDNQRLIQELEIHRIELEMQNSELRLARQELESALERFTDLYEFAPVGYVTLDSTGIINSLNLAGASLLGGVRSLLIGRNFRQFVAATHKLSFSNFLGKVLACQVKESCDVALLNKGIIVQIEAMVTASGQEFRLVLVDITEKRCSEDALVVKQRELEDLNSCLVERVAEAVSEQRRMDQIATVQDRNGRDDR